MLKHTLTINDIGFAVRKLIDDAPDLGMPREFAKNAEEATDSTMLNINKINVDGTMKAIFLNDGIGMDKDKLHKLGQLFGSDKNLNGDLDGNNNTGARVMAIKSNRLGVVFVSSHKGKIHGKRISMTDGYIPVIEDETELVRDYPKMDIFNMSEKKGDWTAVILLGNRKEQNTYENMYDNESLRSKNLIEFQIQHKFFDSSITMYLNSNNRINLFKEYVDIAEEKNTSWNVTLDNGVVLKYNYLTKWAKNDTSIRIFKPLSAIIFKNELFSVHRPASNKANVVNSIGFMTKIGAYAIREKLSVIVDVTNLDSVRMTHYRDNLKMNNNVQKIMSLGDFEDEIIDNMPQELLDIIDKASSSMSTIKTSERFNERLMNVIKSFHLNTRQPISSRAGLEQHGSAPVVTVSVNKIIISAKSKRTNSTPKKLNNNKGDYSSNNTIGIRPNKVEFVDHSRIAEITGSDALLPVAIGHGLCLVNKEYPIIKEFISKTDDMFKNKLKSNNGKDMAENILKTTYGPFSYVFDVFTPGQSPLEKANSLNAATAFFMLDVLNETLDEYMKDNFSIKKELVA
jgi:hypothetical protein